MIFTKSNHRSLSKLLHLSSPKYKYNEPSIESTLAQSPHGHRLCHYYIPLIASYTLCRLLASRQHLLAFLKCRELKMHCMHIILLSIAISDVISRFSNTPTVRLRIARIKRVPNDLTYQYMENYF